MKICQDLKRLLLTQDQSEAAGLISVLSIATQRAVRCAEPVQKRRQLMHSASTDASGIADPRTLSWWTETDLRTDSLHQSDAPLVLTWCSWLLTCSHTAWKWISAPLFFCTFGQETEENFKISLGQLALCQGSRIKRQHAVRSAGRKVLTPNAGFLMASMPSYCHF